MKRKALKIIIQFTLALPIKKDLGHAPFSEMINLEL